MDQALQVAGSIAILIGFLLLQRGRIGAKSLVYLSLNTIGALMLCVAALEARQWGFVLLESVWTIVSGVALLKAMRRQGSTGVEDAAGRNLGDGASA